MKQSENYRQLIRFTVPVVAERLLMILAGTAGTAFLGHLGAAQLSASSLAISVINITQSMFIGIGFGATVAVASAADDDKKQNDFLNNALYIGLFAALVVLAALMLFAEPIIFGLFRKAEPAVRQMTAQYLRIIAWSVPFLSADVIISSGMRGAGDSKTPFFIMLLTNLSNILLLVLFLSVLHFDFRGAAYAYFIATVFGGLVKFAILVSHRYRIYLNLFQLPNWKGIKRIASVGLPSMTEKALIQTAFLGMQMVTTLLGTKTLAGYQAANSVLQYIYAITYGIETALVSFVSMYKNKDKALTVYYVKASLKTAQAVTCAFAGSLLILAPFVLKAFFHDADVLQESTVILRLMCLTVPITTCFQVCQGILKTGSEIKYVVAMTLACPYLVRIPVSLFLIMRFDIGFYGMYAGFFADYLLRAGVYYYRYLKRKWLNDSPQAEV